VGGIALGASTGRLLDHVLAQEQKVSKKKVFVSYDFENDRALKEFIVGQSLLPDSPFVISDLSLKRAAPEAAWENVARSAIRRSDIVIVMVGPETYRAQGVLKEVAMARQDGIRIVQMIGYRDSSPRSVLDAGRLYRWNWENLKNLLR